MKSTSACSFPLDVQEGSGCGYLDPNYEQRVFDARVVFEVEEDPRLTDLWRRDLGMAQRSYEHAYQRWLQDQNDAP